jgi:hypothetical protein
LWAFAIYFVKLSLTTYTLTFLFYASIVGLVPTMLSLLYLLRRLHLVLFVGLCLGFYPVFFFFSALAEVNRIFVPEYDPYKPPLERSSVTFGYHCWPAPKRSSHWRRVDPLSRRFARRPRTWAELRLLRRLTAPVSTGPTIGICYLLSKLPPIDPTPVSPVVGGAGLCWSRIPFVLSAISEHFGKPAQQCQNVSAHDLVPVLKKLNWVWASKEYSYLVDFVEIDDRNLHINSVSMVPRVPSLKLFKSKLGAKKPYLATSDGRLDIRIFTKYLEDLPCLPPLVGSVGAEMFLDTPLRSAVVSPHVQDYLNDLARKKRRCPFNVDPSKRYLLKMVGLDEPAPFSPAHDHPIHYALELAQLHFLKDLLISKRWFALFLRPEKVGIAGLSEPAGYFAPKLVGPDLYRYRSLPEVMEPPRSDQPVWFAHDAVHHLSPSEVGSWFDNNPSLNYLFATIVVPPELIRGHAPAFPELYTYETIDDQFFTYVPEGDHTGSYTQQTASVQWLQANALVTPKGEHLHVGRLNPRYAHSILCVSRPQLIAEHARVHRSNDLFIVPWYVMPFASEAQRVTSFDLYQKLCDFATMVKRSDVPDLYAKVSQYRIQNEARYPPWVRRSAVIAAYTNRMLDYYMAGEWDATKALLWFGARNLPAATISAIAQTIAAGSLTWPRYSPMLLYNKPITLISHPKDARLSYHPSERCHIKVSPFYMSPVPTRLEALAVLNASLCAYLAIKVGIAEPLIYAWDLRKTEWWIVKQIVWYIDWSPQRFVLSTIALIISSFYDLLPVSPLISMRLAFSVLWPDFEPLNYYVGMTLAYIFMLPAANLPYTVGGSYLWQLFLFVSFVNAAFPRLPWWLKLWRWFNEWDVISDDPAKRLGELINLPYGRLIVFCGIAFPLLLALSLIYAYFRHHAVGRSRFLPFHRAEAGYGTFDLPKHAIPPPPPPPGSSGGPSIKPPRPPIRVRKVTRFAHKFDPEDFEVVPSDHPNQPPNRAHLYVPPKRYTTAQKGKAVDPRERPGPSKFPGAYVPPPAVTSVPAPPVPPSGPPQPVPLVRLPRPANRPPSPVPGPRAVLPVNPYARWGMSPALFETPALFVDALLSAYDAQPPPNQLMTIRIGMTCVWDTIGAVLRCDPFPLWVNYMASVRDPLIRANLDDGQVQFDQLGAVAAHFRIQLTVYSGTYHANDGSTSVAKDAQPLIFGTAEPNWPSTTALLTERNGTLHLQVGAPFFVQAAIAPRVNPTSRIALTTRVVPFNEIEPIMNFPTGGSAIYDAFTGFLNNAAAMASQGFGFRPIGPQPVPPFAPLPVRPVVREEIQWDLTDSDWRIADDLANDIFKNLVVLQQGEGNPSDTAAFLKAQTKFKRPRSIKLTLLNGCTGSGKSHQMKEIMREMVAQPDFNVNLVRVHTWFEALRSDVRAEFEPIMAAGRGGTPSGWNFPSGPVLYYQNCSGTLFLDDAGQLWPGTLQLLAIINPSLKHIVCSFDAAQSKAPFPMPNAVTRQAQATVDFLSEKSANYATTMYRPAEEIRDLFGFPRFRKDIVTHGHIYLVSKPPRGVPVIVASPRYAEVIIRGSAQALTFAEVQGLTMLGDIVIDCGGYTDSIGDGLLWPVLTRSRNNVFLLISPQMPIPKMLNPTSFGRSIILSSILAVAVRKQTALITADADDQRIIARSVHDHLSASLALSARTPLGLPNPRALVAGDFFSQPLVTSASQAALEHPHRDRQSKPFGVVELPADHPFESDRDAKIATLVQPFFPVSSDMELRAPPPEDEVPEPFLYSAPPDPTLLMYDVMDSDRREMKVPGIDVPTQQVMATPRFLHHKRSDPATVRASELKRLRVGQYDGSMTQDDRKRLNQLISGFQRLVPVKSAEDMSQDSKDALFNEAVRLSLRSWAGKKSTAEVAKSLADSEPDWHPLFTKQFLKGQKVKKLPVAFGRAKAGQIVSTFPKDRLFEDAVWAKYVELYLKRFKPKSMWWHDKTNSALREWYKGQWQPGVTNTATDYTAWDSGCDHVFAYFDAWILQTCGIPQDYIDGYLHRKFNTRGYLGPYLPMQFSGDRWTWLFNTTRNVAITSASYAVPYDTPCAFSGDDMILNGAFQISKAFEPHKWLMVPKPEQGVKLEFCGWQFGDTSLYLSERVITNRVMGVFELGMDNPSHWNSMDLDIRHGPRDPASSAMATAIQISHDARRYYNLPPSKFPHLVPPRY